jgi:hypothetical protein
MKRKTNLDFSHATPSCCCHKHFVPCTNVKNDAKTASTANTKVVLFLGVGQYFALPDAAAAISGKIGRVGSKVEESVLFLERATFDLGVVIRGADEADTSSIATGAERIIKGPAWCKREQKDRGVTCVRTSNSCKL